MKNSNTTLVKVKFFITSSVVFCIAIQIQHLLKLNLAERIRKADEWFIQIQHLLKLNYTRWYR